MLKTLLVVKSYNFNGNCFENLEKAPILENLDVTCCSKINATNVVTFCRRKSLKALTVCTTCLKYEKEYIVEQVRDVNATIEIVVAHCLKYTDLFN
jgi:hypothetical protein